MYIHYEHGLVSGSKLTSMAHQLTQRCTSMCTTIIQWLVLLDGPWLPQPLAHYDGMCYAGTRRTCCCDNKCIILSPRNIISASGSMPSSDRYSFAFLVVKLAYIACLVDATSLVSVTSTLHIKCSRVKDNRAPCSKTVMCYAPYVLTDHVTLFHAFSLVARTERIRRMH
jgi:hypothetical protein